MSNVRVSLLACAALLATVTSTSAQVRITGGIAGTVTDTSEAVIPGAAVVLKDEGTGVTRETVTMCRMSVRLNAEFSVLFHLASCRQGREYKK